MGIKGDDLQGKHADLVRIIGIDRFLALCEFSGGTSIYVPKKNRVLQRIRNTEIKRDFEGRNYAQLASRYGLSERRIRQIVDSGRFSKRQKK